MTRLMLHHMRCTQHWLESASQKSGETSEGRRLGLIQESLIAEKLVLAGRVLLLWEARLLGLAGRKCSQWEEYLDELQKQAWHTHSLRVSVEDLNGVQGRVWGGGCNVFVQFKRI